MNQQKKKSEVRFTVAIIGEVITTPWIVTLYETYSMRRWLRVIWSSKMGRVQIKEFADLKWLHRM